MKLKIIALAMAAALAVTAFAGCAARNNEGNNISTPITNPVPELESRLEEGADRIESELERGISGLEEDFGVSAPDRDRDDLDDEASLYESHPEASRIDSDFESSESVAAAMSADFSEIGALNGEKDTGFPGGPVDEQNRPSGPVAYQQKYSQYDAYFIVPDSKKIYLTFDEGYENGYTSRILDILKEKNVKAVFFITLPYAKTEKALVERMIAEGHTIGNHSSKHFVYPDAPLQEAATDLATLHDYVRNNYGYEMWLFRPPEGAFSEQTLALAQKLGYSTMLWSFAYKDYDVQNQPLAIEAESNIIQKAHPGEICLLHAVSRTNAEILGSVIDTLRGKGFEFADYFYFQ